jgi:DNA-binding winged helix-turn-helix (wHTH) protein
LQVLKCYAGRGYKEADFHVTARDRINFDGFILDPENEVLWKGAERIRLRPKTFALLLMLAERSGQLVTKKELLNAIWKDWHVKGDEALEHCVVAKDDSLKCCAF